jgi:hypothetical protein
MKYPIQTQKKCGKSGGRVERRRADRNMNLRLPGLNSIVKAL